VLFFSLGSHSQPVSADEMISSSLEDITTEEENVSDNDYENVQLANLLRHPLNINSPETSECPLLDTRLLMNLSEYRALLGDLIDEYELLAVPGFDAELLRKLRPYITVHKNPIDRSTIRSRFATGEHQFLARPVLSPAPTAEKAVGDESAFLFRYKYYGKLLQYGVTAEKDAGEPFFKAGPLKLPDFISFHLFARQVGIFKSVALGDYTINLGQGLVHWQSLAYKKSASVLNIKRQSEILRPYHSAGEYNFHRGIAATLSRKHKEVTVFASIRKVSANVQTNDSIQNFITSIQISGLHRTVNEIEDRNKIIVYTAGSNVKLSTSSDGYLGFNSVYYTYSLPLEKRIQPYNLYAFRGRRGYNYSLDFSRTLRNFHFFGEASADHNLNKACLGGVMAALGRFGDMAIQYRNISKSYQAPYGNAFTENTMPSNENGFYTGISIKPKSCWQVDLYADIFSFPWLKFRVDAPSQGSTYLSQLTWKPDKKTEIYTRYRYRSKPLNLQSPERIPHLSPDHVVIENWRTHFGYRLSHNILLRSRLEVCRVHNGAKQEVENGFLIYSEVIFQPATSLLTGNFRIQSFESDSYDSRIYAYENDVMFATSIPPFFNTGTRYYVNIKAKFRLKKLSNRELSVCIKASNTIYNNFEFLNPDESSHPKEGFSIRFQANIQ
jgi:hypothetical protein